MGAPIYQVININDDYIEVNCEKEIEFWCAISMCS